MTLEGSSSNIFISLIIFLFLELSSSTWNFSTVNLPDDVPIWRFAIWRNRAFLSVLGYASRKSISDNDSEIALLEAGWPEPENNYTFVAMTGSAVHVFPKTRKHVSDQCERLLSVTGLDVDARGRLWILDSHTESDCPAKIIVYDLRRNDREINRIDLQGIAKRKLRSLVVDPVIGKSGPRAYIGDPGDETLITYSLSHQRWWKLKLHHGPDVPRVFSTEIAISRKSSLLYLTGTRSQDLFSFDLEQTRTVESPPWLPDEATQHYTVKWLGTKMGRSSGMVCDQKGGLHYFLVTEHASVRWDTKHDLKTSSYSILLQSDEVPCITDYRIDSQRNVWGLVNLEHPFVRSSSSNFTKQWNAKFRTVRVFKYNRFGP